MQRVLSIIVWAVLCLHFASSSEVFAGSEFKQQYLPIAQKIIDEIKALKTHFPEFKEVETTAKIQQSEIEEHFWFELEYARGMTYVPNPEYIPNLECGKANWPKECKKGGNPKSIKKFSEDGIYLRIIFYEGDWRGTAAVRPEWIGDMNIVWFLEGPVSRRQEEINDHIRRLIQAEKTCHEKEMVRQR